MYQDFINQKVTLEFSEEIRERLESPPETFTIIISPDREQDRDKDNPSPIREDVISCYQDGPSWIDLLFPTNYQDGYLYYNMSTLCE